MATESPPGECTSCGTEFDRTYRDCPNCGKGFFMPPVRDQPACEDCGERFERHRYECPDCNTNVLTLI